MIDLIETEDKDMLVTAENLTTDTPEFTNITLFTGGIGEIVHEAIVSEIDSFEWNYHDTTGNELPNDWFDEVTWDYDGAYRYLAECLPDILIETYPELFTADKSFEVAPVFVGEVGEVNPHDLGGWGREEVMAPLWIHVEGVKALMSQYGITEIHDGHGISGFIRTAEDGFWTQLQVIRELMEAMDGSYFENLTHKLQEYASSDGWSDEYINYPGKLITDLFGL